MSESAPRAPCPVCERSVVIRAGQLAPHDANGAPCEGSNTPAPDPRTPALPVALDDARPDPPPSDVADEANDIERALTTERTS